MHFVMQPTWLFGFNPSTQALKHDASDCPTPLTRLYAIAAAACALGHTIASEMLARVRVFWNEACVGYYTREVSSVPRTTPGAIYRPETRLPEQKLR